MISEASVDNSMGFRFSLRNSDVLRDLAAVSYVVLDLCYDA
jgi:hypothetical protein